jgi:deoxyribodipyrimidine photo-lyase
MLKSTTAPLTAAASAAASAAVAASSSIGLVWFQQNNLRLHDNELLLLAHQRHQHVIHLFCFEDYYHQTSMTISRSLPTVPWMKTGPYRTKFLLESVQNLRANLLLSNQQLVIRRGKIHEILLDLVMACQDIDTIYCQQSEVTDEILSLHQIRQHLHAHVPSPRSVRLMPLGGSTLYRLEDFPFRCEPNSFPASASSFRQICEKKVQIQLPVSLPLNSEGGYVMRPPPPFLLNQSLSWCGEVPLLTDLCPISPPHAINENKKEWRGSYSSSPEPCLVFQGGETAALQRLQDYFWTEDCLKTYFQTRNGLLGPNFSSKFSPWLATGCLSPRLVAQEVRRYEQERVRNKDTSWLIVELQFREYFKFYSLCHGSKIFHQWGPRSSSSAIYPQSHWNIDLELLDRWCQGQTGNPFVDANMRELNETGWMSNRGRQVVASFLTRDLCLDWRLGAMYFESLLIDHDPALNWGNWTYAAGVGSDPREDRYFLIPKQVQNYDPEYRYIHHWLEETKFWSPERMRVALRRGIRSTSSSQRPATATTSKAEEKRGVTATEGGANTSKKKGGKGKRRLIDEMGR